MRVLLGEVWEFIVDLWDTGNFYIRLAIVLILGWPVALTLLVVFGGIRGDFAVSLALMPAAALVLFLLVIPPMLPVLVLAVPSQPLRRIPILGRIQFPTRAERLTVLKRALKFLTLVAGIETAIGIYLAGVPVWKDPGLILWLFAFTVFFMLMRFSGIRHRWVARGYAMVFLVITAIFFLGGRELARQLPGRAVQAVSQVQASQATPSGPQAVSSMENIREVVRIPLLGENVPSEKALLLPGAIPPLWYYYFEGPPNAQVHYDDGTVGPITKWFGLKGGSLKFSGPKGQEVVVRAYPPS